MERIFHTDHLLMKLLAGPDAHDLMFCIGGTCKRNVRHLHRRDFLYIYLTANHVFKGVPYQLDALLQTDHESGHACIGDRQCSLLCDRKKEWDNRPARTHHIAVTHYTKPRAVRTRI